MAGVTGPLLAAFGTTPVHAATPIRDTWYLDRLDLAAASAPPLAPVERVPPYRTQLDGSTYSPSNCGPAVLGMALDGYGIHLDTLELRRITHTYQGTWPAVRVGTALQHIARVANEYGVAGHGLYGDADEFHRWSAADVADQVERGRWVIPLVRFGLLPGHESSGVRFGHYILIYAAHADGYLYHDPAFRPVELGPARWISRAQLDPAMAPVWPPRQGLALGP